MTHGSDSDEAADRDAHASRLAAVSLAAGDPTGWLEALYAEAAEGTASIPWGRVEASAALVEWLAGRDQRGGRALVVGCGYGRDAQYVAARGYDTTGFDVSPTAIATARARHPDSPVHYEVADLLALPSAWLGAFDLVVESHNVQALPVDLHARAAAAVSSLVAPGGTLLVLGAVPDVEPEPGPPWPLARAEIDAFAGERLMPVRIESGCDETRDVSRWRAEFRRPALVGLRAVVSGRVQGVGFRVWTREQAVGLRLSGTAVNLPDGRVEVVAEGDQASLEAFVESLRGPDAPGAVREVLVSRVDSASGRSGFSIA